MNQRRRIAGFALMIAVAAGLAIFTQPPGEPVHRGRPLSAWLDDLVNSQDPNRHALAVDAVRSIGTNALPSLIKMLRAKDSSYKMQLAELARKYSVAQVKFTYAAELHLRASAGIGVLKANAAPAIPTLVELLNDHDASIFAALSLAKIGTHAVPSLMSALTNDLAEARACAALALGGFDPIDAAPAVPALLRTAHDNDSTVRGYAIASLGKLALQPDRVVPTLLSALHDPDAQVRVFAIYSMGRFRQQSDLITPVLTNSLNDPSPSVREAATNALSIFGLTNRLRP